MPIVRFIKALKNIKYTGSCLKTCLVLFDMCFSFRFMLKG
jgi:hypothetical protein